MVAIASWRSVPDRRRPRLLASTPYPTSLPPSVPLHLPRTSAPIYLTHTTPNTTQHTQLNYSVLPVSLSYIHTFEEDMSNSRHLSFNENHRSTQPPTWSSKNLPTSPTWAAVPTTPPACPSPLLAPSLGKSTTLNSAVA